MQFGSIRSVGSVGSVKKLKMFNFSGSDGSVIQSGRVCKFMHCDTTRALINENHLCKRPENGYVKAVRQLEMED